MNNIKGITFDEIIAERELTYNSVNGVKSLIVKLGKPRPDSKTGRDWECPIQVGEKIILAFGVDSYQALSLAQQIISIQLRYLKDNQKLNIKWMGQDDLGFEPIIE